MLFDASHIWYIVISTVLSVLSLFLAFKFVKNQLWKNRILKFFAITTVILHFSSLFVDYFSTGTAEIENTMILPVYPCNVTMWLLLFVAYKENKQSVVFKVLAEIVFYLGIIGGVVGILFNEIYSNTPDLSDWDVLKGLLSHSTLICGSIYLLVGGYIKIRVANTISAFCGAVLLFLDGWLVIGLHMMFGLEAPNSMYLLENPFPDIPWFNTTVLGLSVVLLIFLITVLYEQIALRKEDRWYFKLKQKFNKGENK